MNSKEEKALELMKSTIPVGLVGAVSDVHAQKLFANEPVAHVGPIPSPETERVLKAVEALGGVDRVATLGHVLNAQEAAKRNPVERKYEDIKPRHITPKDMDGIMRNTLRVGARPSCKRCNGTGIYGYKSGTNIPLLCSCTRITGVLT